MDNQFEAVNRAFTKQSFHYDHDDRTNIVLKDMRAQVYEHVDRFIKPNSFILELNAGTGIDAMRFVNAGHRVHATDLSTGMVRQMEMKIQQAGIESKLTCQQVSFNQLDKVVTKEFDYVFSNFGGLNCIQDLSDVTRHLPEILKVVHMCHG
jgi:ubiquinone/menaquinone biosynthesis C-methylase UbiE